MSDIITIVAFLNAIEYTYTFIRIAGKYYTYLEINKKLQYYENVKTVYDLSRNINIKKNNKCKIYKMGLKNKLLGFVADVSVARLERRARYKEMDNERLLEARKAKQKRDAEKQEKELFKIGFLKDKLSKHYIAPDELLHDIYSALLAKYPEDKEVFDRLVLNKDAEDLDESDFAEISKYLIYVKIEDRLTGCDFCSKLLDEPVYAAGTIVWLQQKVKYMYKVNRTVIEHENAMCPPRK